MRKLKLALLFGLILCNDNIVFAKDSINCAMNGIGNAASHCEVTLQNANTDEFSHNIKIIRKIDLNPMVKSFKKIISKQLNKRECEKKVFVKSARLKLNKDSLYIDLRARITRQYCTRRAKQQVYEKTKSLKFSLSPIVTDSSISFIDETPDKNQAAFEKSFSDVLDMNIKNKISQVFNSNLSLDVNSLSLPFNLKNPIFYRSATIDANTGTMTIIMTTAIDKDKAAEFQ